MGELLPTAWLNGDFLPLVEARISPLDRGFLFGEGIYEVIPVYGGQPMKLPAHLARLERSCRITDIPNPLAGQAGDDLVHRLIDKNGGGDMSIYIQITRGADPAGRNHVWPDGLEATVFAMCQRVDSRPPSVAHEGVAAVTAHDNRWERCDIKSTSLIANTLLRQDAHESGALESILLRDGRVTEGAASSVVVVTDGRAKTTPNGNEILPGTTLEVVSELFDEAGIDLDRSDVSEAELRSADEILLISSVREVLPVCHLDGKPVGAGVPGPVWQDIDSRYQTRKADLRAHGPHPSLLEFPCEFPIKIMGQHTAALRPAIEKLARSQGVDTVSVSERTSRGGRYLAVTLTVNAQSRAQLDRLYEGITTLDHVVVVL